jgi:excisionase family DNA binding protein
LLAPSDGFGGYVTQACPEETVARTYETLESAAQRLDVHPRTLRRMGARGEITLYRVGSKRLLRVDPNEVDAAVTPVPTVGGPDAAA